MGDDNPQISVIIPVYNNAEDVQRCLDSIAGQTYADWEAICVDDGSTDASGEILDQMAARDSRFKIIHQANGGASRARNTGLAHVTAPYITMVDADDWLENKALEQLYTCMQQNPCDLVVAGRRKVYKSKEPIEGFPAFAPGVYRLHPSYILFLNRGPCGKLYKREILHRNHIEFPENVVWGEDYVFNVKYWCHAKKVYCMKEIVYNYVESMTSVSDKFLAGMLPHAVYEAAIRLSVIVHDSVLAYQGGNHLMSDWVKAIAAGHLIEQSWVIDDVPHTWEEKRRLRKISRECYSELACHLKFSERFHIKMLYYVNWWRCFPFRVLGKIKRALKKMLRIW